MESRSLWVSLNFDLNLDFLREVGLQWIIEAADVIFWKSNARRKRTGQNTIIEKLNEDLSGAFDRLFF